jgi:hypothetical protein
MDLLLICDRLSTRNPGLELCNYLRTSELGMVEKRDLVESLLGSLGQGQTILHHVWIFSL